jgi:hypothetical protein
VSASSSIHLEIISTCIKFRTYLFFQKNVDSQTRKFTGSIFIYLCYLLK